MVLFFCEICIRIGFWIDSIRIILSFRLYGCVVRNVIVNCECLGNMSENGFGNFVLDL